VAETLHVFVGTDRLQQQAGAELVLEHSIRKHATCPVDLHWMRAGDPEWPVSEDGIPAGSWKLGRPVDLAWPKKGWGTPFSCFRFAVPELMAFTGRAVYLDADMLVLGDVAELLRFPMKAGYTCCHAKRTDTSVIDCEWFRGKKWWPTIKQMKPTGWRVYEFLNLLLPNKAISDTLPWAWNDCDGELFASHPKKVKLAHFTAIPTQPYRPYPSVNYSQVYPFHPCYDLGHLWWNTYLEALTAAHGEPEAIRIMQDAVNKHASAR